MFSYRTKIKKLGEKLNKRWCNIKELNGRLWLFLLVFIFYILLEGENFFKSKCFYYKIFVFVNNCISDFRLKLLFFNGLFFR